MVPRMCGTHPCYDEVRKSFRDGYRGCVCSSRDSNMQGRAGRHVPGTNDSTIFTLRCNLLPTGVGMRRQAKEAFRRAIISRPSSTRV